MSLDFLQVSLQVKQLGEKALVNQHDLKTRLAESRLLLEERSQDVESLQQKGRAVGRNYDQTLRCAVPVQEALNAHFTLPLLPGQVTLLAADGSKLFGD